MKVGKAIYNILSQSTDVQSNFPFNTTDYSPTGTELVTNGDFSATGGELITNGDFSNGEEQVLNGDFKTDLADWNNKSATSAWVSGSAVIDNSTGNASGGIYQNIGLISGKSYKLTATLKLNSGDSNGAFKVLTSSSGGSSQSSLFTGDTLIIGGASVTQTFYFTHSGTNVSIQFACDAENAIFELDNVSVKELGEGWTSADGDIDTYNDNGLTITSITGLLNRVYQTNITQAEKPYKVTYTIEATSYSSGTRIRYYNDGWVNLPEQDAGTHTFYYTRLGTENSWYFDLESSTSGSTTDTVTISSISVEELGEGWTLGTGWSIGEDKAIYDGSGYDSINQPISNISGKSLKITFEIQDWQSGTIRIPPANRVDGLDERYSGDGENVIYYKSTVNALSFQPQLFDGSITNISVEEMAVNKIFPELAPPDIDAPYVVYSVVSNSPSETKNTNGDIDTANIEVYGFQDTYNKAVDLGVSVRAALDRKTGTYNTIEIQSTNYVNEQMDVNEARKLWAAIQDYTIRIKNI